MILGKTLRVFAATLVLTSSISIAGEGTGTTNTTKTPLESGASPSSLIFPNVEATEILPDGSTENVAVGFESATTENEAEQLGDYLDTELQKNAEAGGQSSVVLINPDPSSREWLAKSLPYTSLKAITVVEKDLSKSFNDRANAIMTKAISQIAPDGKFGERATKFKEEYKKDISTFFQRKNTEHGPGKGFDKFNITVSLIRMTLNSGTPFLVAVASHGFHNVAPQVAFMPYLALGIMSGVVFTYLAPFIPWNRDLPLPADTKFWKKAEYAIQGVLYYLSEGLFVEGFRFAQMSSNRWALSRQENPQFKVMTEADNWKIPGGVSAKTTVGQSPYDLSFGTTFKEGNANQDALLEAHPEMASQVEASKKNLLNMLALKGTIVSVLITIGGLVGAPGSLISKVIFKSMYIGAAITVSATFDITERIRDFFTPEPVRLPRFTPEERAEACDASLQLIK